MLLYFGKPERKSKACYELEQEPLKKQRSISISLSDFVQVQLTEILRASI